MSAQPSSPSRPILIIGAPRSGTTLLATMLNAHPDVFLANETKLLIDFLPENPGPIEVETVARRLLAAAEERELVDLPTLSELVDGAQGTDVAGIVRRLFETMARTRGKERWGEKTAVAYRRLPVIVRDFPDACYIGLDRNLPKVAASYARINPQWGPEGGLLHWLDYHRTLARHGRGLGILRVRYEQLVDDPPLALREVCRFVGVPFDPAMLQHHLTTRARDLGRAEEFAGASRPVYRRSEQDGPDPLPAWLRRSAESYARRLRETERDLPPPAWEPILRAAVNARLVFREARSAGPGATLRKVIRTVVRR